MPKKTRIRRRKRKPSRKGGFFNKYNPYKTFGDNLRDWKEGHNGISSWSENVYWPSKNNIFLQPDYSYFADSADPEKHERYKRYQESKNRYIATHPNWEKETVSKSMGEVFNQYQLK
jgi:hypothetical protein